MSGKGWASPLGRRLVEWVIFLESGYLLSWLALSLIRSPRTPVHVDSLEGLVFLAVGGFLFVRAINYPRQRDLQTLVVLSAVLGIVVLMLAFFAVNQARPANSSGDAEQGVSSSAPVQSGQKVWLSPETVLSGWKSSYGQVLGNSRQTALARFGKPSRTSTSTTNSRSEFLRFEPSNATDGRLLMAYIWRGKVINVTVFATPSEDLRIDQVLASASLAFGVYDPLEKDADYVALKREGLEEVLTWHVEGGSLRFRSVTFNAEDWADELLKSRNDTIRSAARSGYFNPR